jgi:hypothetical protein
MSNTTIATTEATVATTTTVAAAFDATSNKHIAAFAKACEAYGRAVGTFKERTVKTVLALRAEGYDDKVIAAALRDVVEKHGVSRQHLNRVLTAPAAEGGAGMAPTRKHEPKAPKGGLQAEANHDSRSKGAVTVDLSDANSLFAALLTQFEGKAAKIVILAERLNELAQAAIEKAAKAAK